VTLIELTTAYGVIANEGRTVEPYIVHRVRTSSGKVIYQHASERPKTVVAPAQVAAINDMLRAVVSAGTGRRAALAEHPVAGKTGTSQDFRDAWFVGYTAHLVGGVWVGNDDRRPMHRVVGGSLPAKMWREIMSIAHEGRSPQPVPGTAVLSAAISAPSRARPENALVLPSERIDTQFIDRALAPQRTSTP
jgi:penicillin-binding protein 1A